MASVENANSASQIISAVTPIAIFIAGILFSRLDKFSERRRDIRNMKTILFKELSDNYKKLNPFLPSDMNFHPSLVQIPALTGIGISTTVYDAYLSRLAELKSAELKHILDAYGYLQIYAYGYLQIYKDSCEKFLDMQPEELDVQKSIEAKMKVNAFVNLMSITHSNTEKALSVFQDGKKFITEEKQNRGCTYKEIFDQCTSAAAQNKLKQ